MCEEDEDASFHRELRAAERRYLGILIFLVLLTTCCCSLSLLP